MLRFRVRLRVRVIVMMTFRVWKLGLGGYGCVWLSALWLAG